ncbi:MAG: prepilin-type N-terminal cleavage/methylation domain-containing protein [Methylobacter sp.]|jgi:prepilin peptidase dependent protein B|uniref:PilW family protein n=1 Tax=Methylobacter sp. TaxID=2051955 RepID=UPI0025D8B30E|nr:prepilin-type N-terminal cleavage/methylation domain-containing protein [Methylobacter sp.]MCK9622068.1 prepilin-type N-terminal cleavage/methylation domain-containing protein [Methylobacter sp.]
MKEQKGYTLIELMIATAIGLIVVGATISIYITAVGSSSNTIKSARLNHDLEAAMALMINDIKRAGYWNGAVVGVDSRNNPFTAAATNINIPISTCILYSYDADDDGIVDANEHYGFKLTNNTLNMRGTGTTTNSADCSNGTWESFIDNTQLTITQLQFSFVPVTGLLPATSRCLNVTTDTVTDAAACATDATNCTAATPCNIAEKRVVNIRLSGQLTSDTSVTKTLNGTVEVRNSRLLTQP